MIHGCSASAPARWETPVVVDLTAARCPEIDDKTRAEFKRTTRRPAGPVSKDGARAWIDRLETSEQRKNLAGQRVIDEFDRCRGQEPKVAASRVS